MKLQDKQEVGGHVIYQSAPTSNSLWSRPGNTHSLFFSLMLAPFRSSSSVTCFLLGCGEATAQC